MVETTKNNLADKIGQLAASKNAQDILILDLRSIADFFDFFVILSGSNTRQVKIFADFITEELKREKIRPRSVEGSAEAGWILIDYGEVIVHVFLEETRNFYQIEKLFKSAPSKKIEA